MGERGKDSHQPVDEEKRQHRRDDPGEHDGSAGERCRGGRENKVKHSLLTRTLGFDEYKAQRHTPLFREKPSNDYESKLSGVSYSSPPHYRRNPWLRNSEAVFEADPVADTTRDELNKIYVRLAIGPVKISIKDRVSYCPNTV